MLCNAQKRSGEALDHFIVKIEAPKSCINSPKKHKSVFAKQILSVFQDGNRQANRL